MKVAWAMKMAVYLCLLLAAVGVFANTIDERRSNLPFVADAVGNTLPPPSQLPATVGSPVDLLTPDRYEFYTFDESGDLVKRLMTLEEIQAIVAAGEETEGLVTFANDNQPTIAFNFSQPSYTKVHNVVTNVQNVLKAQMEAHKKKPQLHPTLDTPDVSDSWSLILPSIFGNTGVDIVPDKSTTIFTTPETEMIEIENPKVEIENSLSKEDTAHVLSSSTAKMPVDGDFKNNLNTEMSTTSTTTTSTTTTTTTISTSTLKPTASTTKPITLITTKKTPFISTMITTTAPKVSTTTTSTPLTSPKTVSTTKTTTIKPVSSTGATSPSTITTSYIPSTKKTITTTNKPTTSFSTMTEVVSTTFKPISTTQKTISSSTTEISSHQNEKNSNVTEIKNQSNSNIMPTTNNVMNVEKITTFIPVSMVSYVTERLTQKPIQTTMNPAEISSSTKVSFTTATPVLTSTIKSQMSINPTTYKPSLSTFISSTIKELEKNNATTITTQSVSPSTTVSSTEFMSADTQIIHNLNKEKPNPNINKINQPVIPLFDVEQSISQIASDLGSNTNYQPIPTTSNIVETTKVNGINLEGKESLEIDMENTKNTTDSTDANKEEENFVKITTFDPHKQDVNLSDTVRDKNEQNENKVFITTTTEEDLTTMLPTATTIDPILSESMGDLLSQVVNQAPQSIMNENSMKEELKTTTESVIDTTTVIFDSEILSQKVNKTDKDSNVELEESQTNKDITSNIYHNDDIKQTLSEENKLNEGTNNQILLNTEKESKLNVSNNDLITITILPTKSNLTKKESNLVTEVSKNKTDIVNNIINNNSSVKQKQTLAVKEDNKTPAIISNKNQMTEPIVATNASEKMHIKTDTLTVDSVTKPTVVKNEFLFNKNIINVTDNNRISETYPKIDEFKKKIQKVNIDDKELANERNTSWKLIPTVSPPKLNDALKDKQKIDTSENYGDKDIVLDFSKENQGLEVTTKDLGNDIAQFTELCNELAFRYWNALAENIDKKRSFIMSPFSITSLLAMMFMGARGATSGEMNEILKLDDMVTFNPHFTLKNISDSIEITPESGVTVSAFVRELYSDKNKGKILSFYKERAQHFYNGYVEEVNFNHISDIIRRRTNLLVKRYSWGKIAEYMKSNTITMQPPLAAFSANIFQTDCTGSSVDGRDGEMYFVVSPNVRQRRLVPVPAVVYRNGFLAGYDPVLDATAAALGNTNSIVSTLFLMPGQQGNIVHVEDLEALEKRLLESNPTTPTWNRLLRTLLPRIGLELQIPRFSHKSIFNISSTLRKMGLKDLFDADHADLGGLNGPTKDLYLSDMIQSTSFVTCGEGVIAEQHHIEEYPETLDLTRRRRTSRWINGWDEPRDYQRAFHDPHDVGDAMHLPLHLRPRQARVPARNAQPARLKFDRPFLYFVRHNPTGMILYVGRYNPRLLP